MQPLHEKILVKPFMADVVSAGGIILSDAHKEESAKVKVVAVGNGTKKHPMKRKVGEVGYRIKDSGELYVINGENYYLINQNWLICLEKQ